MKRFALLLLLCLFITGAGCMKKPLDPVKYSIPQRKIDYLAEVKPVLDKRCVVCHSCYNSPCQLKLSSYEGADRGASKKAVYNASRLKTMDPTRLFIDAHSTREWQDKGFHSVTQSSVDNGLNDSLMLQLLSHKMKNPSSVGEFFPESDDLNCSEDGSELSSYLQKHPNGGMPLGFPPLTQMEFDTIAGWLVQGAKGPDPDQQREMEEPSPDDSLAISRWETFLNSDDPKHAMTARYLYEHLFLAHIHFTQDSTTFYELVRSTTGPGEEIQVIATVRPYDNPGDSFYYRFRKIHSTIVYKTHMVFTMDEELYNQVDELFIQKQWLKDPQLMGYEKQESSDPFLIYEQIPPESRYRFLLNNAHYFIMTFIRGPVCKGQVALNVIHDHFWIVFLDPDADLAVKNPAFLKLHREKLRMPAEKGSQNRLLKAITNPYHDLAMEYHRVRQDFYMAHYFNGLGYENIWKGEKNDDSPLLTVFRHFDSASVHRGALGDVPRTVWVIDYPLFERIYYSLVAGFDVYGNAGHQLATRLYMDALRREAESNFLDFMPIQDRETMMKEWYQGMDFFHVRYHGTLMPAGITFKRKDHKQEFTDHLIHTHFSEVEGVRFDPYNAVKKGVKVVIPEVITTKKDVFTALHAASGAKNSFFKKVTDHNANLAFLRVRMHGGDDLVISAVVHRWHDNVTFLYGERNTLDSEKDSADFFEGFIGSYPNYFFDVGVDDFRDFALLLEDYSAESTQTTAMSKYGVNRNDDTFWQVYDWFQEQFDNSDPVRSGLFDLNRYYYRGLE